MKDDYLWNRKGEADSDVEHLERVLGQLRHKRKGEEMLHLFDSVPRGRKSIFSRTLSIAAGLIFAALALGTFTILYRESKNQTNVNAPVVMVNPVTPEPTAAPDETTNKSADEIKEQETGQAVRVGPPSQKEVKQPARRSNAPRIINAVSIERERAEGLMAKEQLLKALEITSTSLNSVQKKVQGDSKLGPSS